MAIFKRSEPQPPRSRERPIAPARSGSGDGAISIIGPGMTIVGDIATDGVVRIEGSVRGTVRAESAVILGQSGRVEGNIYTRDAVLGGSVKGSVVATNRLELQSSCVVEGEVSTRGEHLKLEEGARFSGHVLILDTEADDAEKQAAWDPGRHRREETNNPVSSNNGANTGPREPAFELETGVSSLTKASD